MLKTAKKFILLLLGVSSLSFATPAQVIIIRHGEKPTVGNTLSAPGYQRAAALAAFFQTNPQVLRFGVPYAIFAQKQKNDDNSIRPIETITPLAQALGLSVHTPFVRQDFKQLVDLILKEPQYQGKMILVCWEHCEISEMTESFGITPAPPTYPNDRFDLLYIITFPKTGTPSFCCGLQKLMIDDKITLPIELIPFGCNSPLK